MKKLLKLQLREKAQNLKSLPGVYQMLDKEGQVIYIGKSINIKRRVTSYFNPSAKRSKKITRMIHHISNFNVFYTETELDALILECRWIKAYKPFYNTALTRQHKYVYIDIDEEESYKIKASKDECVEGTFRLGPFTSHRLALQGVQYIKSSVPFLCCDFRHKEKIEACYPYQFKMCEGICIQETKISAKKLIEGILGEESDILEQITKKIEVYSSNLEFERAADLLRQKAGVKYLKAMYKLFREIEQEKSYIGVLPIVETRRYKYYLVKNGRIVKSQVAYLSQEKELVKEYKKIARNLPDRQRPINIFEIDEILIIKGFKRKRMRVIKV